jgi:MinD-like ATPase involved in chromosome partitioning or flagellar assembly/ActR/RegA family two-component response regulator
VDETTKTILVIDADAASLNYLAVMLRKNNYTVLTAGSGREGLVMSWQHLPQLIIVDPVLPDVNATDLATRLRQDRRTAHVPLIALSSRSDPQEGPALLSAGFNEYLVKSNQALTDILKLIPTLLGGETLAPAAPAKKMGHLFVFLSAKGGTGTSSLCANIAMCLGKSTAQLRVAVVDLVLPIGSIANIVGYTESMNITTVSAQSLEQTDTLYFKENLPKIPAWYFRLLAGCPDPESSNQLSVHRIPEILEAIQEAYDYVFVDLGRSLSRISLPIIERADLLALVLSTDTAAVTLTRTIWEYLKAQHVDTQRVYPILNRAVGLEGMTKADAESVLDFQIRVTMPYMGGNFSLANNRHEPVAAKFQSDSASIMMMQAASQMADLSTKLRNR